MRRALALAILLAACGRRAQPPLGVGDIGDVARLLFAALEARDFERMRILLPTADEAAGLGPRLGPWAAEVDYRGHFERVSGDGWFDWDGATYQGYVVERGMLDALLVYVEANHRGRRQFHDIRFGVKRVPRGWVLCGPFYCAGRVGELPPLER